MPTVLTSSTKTLDLAPMSNGVRVPYVCVTAIPAFQARVTVSRLRSIAQHHLQAQGQLFALQQHTNGHDSMFRAVAEFCDVSVAATATASLASLVIEVC